jgi:hypothetical protein
VIEEMNESPTALAVKKQWKQRLISRDSRSASIVNETLWHARMSHSESMSLHMLDKNSLEVRLHGSKTVQCSHCNLVKIKHQISQRLSDERCRSCVRSLI